MELSPRPAWTFLCLVLSRHIKVSRWQTATVVDEAALLGDALLTHTPTRTHPHTHMELLMFGVSSDRLWWGFSSWSACWLPASCRRWLHTAPLHVGSSATAGTVICTIIWFMHLFIHVVCRALFIYMWSLLFLPVCSGSNTLQKESCARWPESRCPNRTGETGGSCHINATPGSDLVFISILRDLLSNSLNQVHMWTNPNVSSIHIEIWSLCPHSRLSGMWPLSFSCVNTHMSWFLLSPPYKK